MEGPDVHPFPDHELPSLQDCGREKRRRELGSTELTEVADYDFIEQNSMEEMSHFLLFQTKWNLAKLT